MKVDDLYWLFSTIAQTLGALVAVIGMLSIFKFQNLASYMNELVRRGDTYLSGGIAQIPESIIKELKKRSNYSDVQDEQHQNVLARLMSELELSLATRKEIRDRFMKFIIPNLVLIVASIIAIPFSSILLPWSYEIVVSIGIFLICISLVLSIYLCSSLLKS